jgi:branched-chain amino acid transport system substrate-binding protein
VNLLFGPFSSLITGADLDVAARYGYAMIEGAGGAPAVFNTPSNQAKHNVFDVSYPIVDQYDPLTNWIKSLPPGSGQDRRLPHRRQPVHDPAGAARRSGTGERRRQDGLLQGPPAELPNATSVADQVAATGAQPCCSARLTCPPWPRS